MYPSAGKVTVVNEAHFRINLRTEGAILQIMTSFENPLLVRSEFSQR